MVKLLDYSDRWAELEQSRNLFATVVMAHLKAQETQRDAKQRKDSKLSLIRRLYEEGYSRKDVLNLFKFIDWVMILPESLKQTFWTELKAYEEGRTMPYITSVEQIGFERGRQEGEQLGRHNEALSMILRQLTRRFGEVPEELRSPISRLSIEQLEDLGEALLDFSAIADLEVWLQHHLV
jgi:predicted DNA-binding ribbon-helix-helix protein